MTIDERLEFLLHSSESLNATCKKLTAESNKHDRRWERMRRAALAAEGEPPSSTAPSRPLKRPIEGHAAHLE